MNTKFILNPEPINTFDFAVGVDFHYDKAKGEIVLHHESAINKFLSDNDLQALAPKEFPCTPELYKRIMLEPVPPAVSPTDEEKKVMVPIKSAYLKYLAGMGSAHSKDHGTVGDHRMNRCSAVHG
jgi:hypothetical protein